MSRYNSCNPCCDPCYNPCYDPCCNPCYNPCPAIVSILPTSGCPGTSFTLTTSNLANINNPTVVFIANGIRRNATNLTINGNTITGLVPNFGVLTPTSLKVQLSANDFNCNFIEICSFTNFLLSATTVTSSIVSPTPVGNMLTITGTCLLPTTSVTLTNVLTGVVTTIPASSFTTFNGSTISFIIPPSAGSGTFNVLLNINGFAGPEAIFAGTITSIFV